MTDNNLLKELQDLINKQIDPTMFPYVKGNSIRIGKYIVRSKANGFHRVYCCETNKLIDEMFCKSSAVALARNLAKGRDNTKKIVELDKDIQKWYNDCVFYKQSMDVSNDDMRKEILETRYDIALDKTSQVRRELDKYIYA